VAADGRYAVNRQAVDGRSVELLAPPSCAAAAGGREDGGHHLGRCTGGAPVGGQRARRRAPRRAARLTFAGRHPAVVSRGYGRSGSAPAVVRASSLATEVGDEPWLIQRRTGVPVRVDRDRLAAARALCRRHPEVDVLVLDDGLQHHALIHDAAVVVFDERGVGNGALLPAGPLREPMPTDPPHHWRVLYTAGQRSTRWPGALATRQLQSAWPLAAWHAGDASRCLPLHALRGRSLLAVAGLASPEKFFGMLEAAGLQIRRLPLPDHHPYDHLPWPARPRGHHHRKGRRQASRNATWATRRCGWCR
jgi:tetraacyldisaccharide 4'-kinase